MNHRVVTLLLGLLLTCSLYCKKNLYFILVLDYRLIERMEMSLMLVILRRTAGATPSQPGPIFMVTVLNKRKPRSELSVMKSYSVPLISFHCSDAGYLILFSVSHYFKS